MYTDSGQNEVAANVTLLAATLNGLSERRRVISNKQISLYLHKFISRTARYVVPCTVRLLQRVDYQRLPYKYYHLKTVHSFNCLITGHSEAHRSLQFETGAQVES
jgi:hypothetical protein